MRSVLIGNSQQSTSNLKFPVLLRSGDQCDPSFIILAHKYNGNHNYDEVSGIVVYAKHTSLFNVGDYCENWNNDELNTYVGGVNLVE